MKQKKSWKIPYSRPQTPQSLLDAGYSPLLAALLAARGYAEPSEAAEFISADAGLGSDPFDFTDMTPAVTRVKLALERSEHVAVYGDYDVDGITSTCLLGDYLREKGLLCELYIPDRVEEGYGLNNAAISALFELGVTLIITVDCGVTAVAEVEHAAALGVDMIITDHHECRETLPNAVAVVNPKRPDCGGFEELAGVGVAFKLICAIDGNEKKCRERYCDLVAVGTVADVMPLIGENRSIVRLGLEKLGLGGNPGMAALLEKSGVKSDRLTAMSIGFSLAPRLNAAGRLGQSKLAVELLMEQDAEQCDRLAAKLCTLNRSRQKLETDIWHEALAQLPENPTEPIILASNNWHQGVVGIVASRLADAFSLPCVMICLDGDVGKGSCRSFGGFDLFEALTACADTLEGFGGHRLAAGLTLCSDRVEDFRKAFSDYYAAKLPENPCLEFDLLIDDAELVSMDCVASLGELEPYGNGNPRPQMCMADTGLDAVVPIGEGRHLRLTISKFSKTFECVFFSRTEKDLGLKAGDRVDVAFFPQINEFRSCRNVQLLVSDMQAADTTPLCALILSGSATLPIAASEYLPERHDFAQVWRAVASLNGELSAPIAQVLEKLGFANENVLCSICLAVFAELGLITLSCNGETLKIQAIPGAPKVDLSSSLLLKSIRSAPRGVLFQ